MSHQKSKFLRFYETLVVQSNDGFDGVNFNSCFFISVAHWLVLNARVPNGETFPQTVQRLRTCCGFPNEGIMFDTYDHFRCGQFLADLYSVTVRIFAVKRKGNNIFPLFVGGQIVEPHDHFFPTKKPSTGTIGIVSWGNHFELLIGSSQRYLPRIIIPPAYGFGRIVKYHHNVLAQQHNLAVAHQPSAKAHQQPSANAHPPVCKAHQPVPKAQPQAPNTSQHHPPIPPIAPIAPKPPCQVLPEDMQLSEAIRMSLAIEQHRDIERKMMEEVLRASLETVRQQKELHAQQEAMLAHNLENISACNRLLSDPQIDADCKKHLEEVRQKFIDMLQQ